MDLIFDTVLAEEELEHRNRETELTPDRLKTLLLQTGVPESEAENLRAKLEMTQLANKSKTSQKWPM